MKNTKEEENEAQVQFTISNEEYAKKVILAEIKEQSDLYLDTEGFSVLRRALFACAKNDFQHSTGFADRTLTELFALEDMELAARRGSRTDIPKITVALTPGRVSVFIDSLSYRLTHCEKEEQENSDWFHARTYIVKKQLLVNFKNWNNATVISDDPETIESWKTVLAEY